MSSSVHFKFKSQKEPSRVTFDGTGISVFELKREIISQNRLGDGSDFELAVYNEDTNEEYDDDTTIIPRSTSVIARRLPAARPGKGGAARYVSGKMPANARNSMKPETTASNRNANGSGTTVSNSMSELNSAQTEDEKIKALFSLQANQWKEQQEEMANATPVPFGRGKGKPVNVPEHPPPPGYLCYRCREKGHWIQACPTNNDPKFDGRYRVKRSTGIPRSLQKQVDKPDSATLDGSQEELKNSGVMVNADGDFVIAQPDKASWELYQEKAKASAAAEAEFAAAAGIKELRARNLECPIDSRMFLEPTKTPCCKKTYCNDCITNALIDSDFVCPGCSTEGVLLDNLTVDEEAVARIKDYKSEKAEEKKEKEKQESNQDDDSKPKAETVKSPKTQVDPPSEQSSRPASNLSKKRPAEDDDAAKNEVTGTLEAAAPAMKKQKSEDRQPPKSSSTPQSVESQNQFNPFPFNPQMPFGNPGQQQPDMQGIGFPGNNFMGMPGGMPGMNPMMAPNGGYMGGGMENGWNPMNGMDGMNGMNGMNGMPQQNGMYGSSNFPNPMMANNGYPGANMYTGFENVSMGMNPMNQMQGQMMGQMPNQMAQAQYYHHQGPGMNAFSNQQRTTLNEPFARDEDNAYFRQPVNPHRHQARQRRIRPSDYREL